ncbi:hypothetical protein OZX62_05935 [Bifidobacterium sp. ESL0690]|uniref:hypothetical protein n=1 Tax=Bifidobacterium sp. ESL0690 TaxID=2983214 RepID=UPI0023F98BDF|nr:hypothetical protein [Bifidobacterium sp. ESL0690]WEV46006.1 hypothetical protein OZX62_05935 [Bifidobacterium sp. ESL0690]
MGKSNRGVIGIVAALLCIGSLAGCGAKSSEPSVSDVADRFSAMEKYDVKPNGDVTTVTASKSGTLYVLAYRDDLKKMNAESCTVDGNPMKASTEDLNYPDSKGKNLFAFAQSKVGQAGDHKLSCNQSGTANLKALFEATK